MTSNRHCKHSTTICFLTIITGIAPKSSSSLSLRGHRTKQSPYYSFITYIFMKLKNTSITILLYITWLVIVIMRITLRSFSRVWLLLILLLVILIIKDVLLYMVEYKATEKKTYDRDKIKHDKKNRIYYYLLKNRVYVFPAGLSIYLIYLLITQTHLWTLQHNIFYEIINENFLLVLVVISGILTIFKEDKDTKYQIVKQSMTQTYTHIWLSIFLSLLGTYIIYGQAIQLWWISYIISGIAGILIFLIGILIIEEE